MKLITSCRKCNEYATASTYKTITYEVTDNNLYHIACDCGHNSIVYLEENRYEILLEMGILAFLDGYYREAITNFASSLERLYEYYVKTVCLHNEVDYSIQENAVFVN